MTDEHVLDPLARHLAAPMHSSLVSSRRCQRLSRALAGLIGDQEVGGLDIGCGDGAIAKQIESLLPRVKFTGADVIVRADALVEVIKYDGMNLPFEDKSFDFSMLVDVLHHTQQPALVLKEAARVTRSFIVIKDHYCENARDQAILAFMDWVGNRAHGVALPYNYQSRASWEGIFAACDLNKEEVVEALNLYPFPFSLIFERGLHFAARLATN
jgi:SAM-dependent methyltransferase